LRRRGEGYEKEHGDPNGRLASIFAANRSSEPQRIVPQRANRTELRGAERRGVATKSLQFVVQSASKTGHHAAALSQIPGGSAPQHASNITRRVAK